MKKLLTLLLFTMLLVSTVSAYNFDNVKHYNHNKKIVEINDCSLWLGTCLVEGETIIEMQLVSDLNEKVFDIGEGVYQQVAEIKIDKLKEDYSGDEFGEIKTFYNDANGNEINRDIKLKYRVTTEKNIPNYITECEEVFNGINNTEVCSSFKKGMKKVEEYSWVEFKSISELPKSNIYIGLFADVKPNEIVEWIPNNWFGEVIEEWAVWDSTIDNVLKNYLSMNETTGNNVFNSYNPSLNGTFYNGVDIHNVSYIDGISGTAFNLSYPSANYNFNITDNSDWYINANKTFSIWINTTGESVVGTQRLLEYGASGTPNLWILWLESGEVTLGHSDTSLKTISSGFTPTESKWTNIIYRRESVNATSGNNTLWINGTFYGSFITSNTDGGSKTLYFGSEEAGARYFKGTMDEFMMFNTSLSDTQISNLYNDGAGIFPTEVFFPSVSIVYPTSTSYSDEITNLNYSQTDSESCWYSTDGGTINSTYVTAGTNFTGLTSSIGSNTWTVYCNNSVGLASANVTFIIGGFSENSQIYNTTTIVTSTESFILNASYNSSKWLLVSSKLMYNGTSYDVSNTGNGNELIFEKSLTVPSITGNVSFYWNVSLTNSSSTIYSTSITSYQYLNPLDSINVTALACGGGTFEAMNFTFYDEENLTKINSDVRYNFQYGVGNLTTTQNYGSMNNTDVLRICINSTVNNYKIGSGEIYYTSDDYSSRRYYLFEGTALSNSTTLETKLYSLPNADSTSFLIEIREPTLTPYVDKITALLKWYPNLNEYRIVEMGTTDDKGQTVNKIKVEDVDYRVGVYHQNGSLIYLANPIRMVCLASPCSYTLTVRDTNSYIFNDIYDIETSLTYTDGIFTLIYNDPSQKTQLMELKVYRIGGSASDSLVCENNASSFTGIINCDVTGEEGILKAMVYRSASPTYAIATLIVDTVSTIFRGTFGLFLQFILAVTLIFMGIMSPVVAIIMGLISLLVGVFLFKTMTYPIFIGLGILGGIVIHFMRSANR